MANGKSGAKHMKRTKIVKFLTNPPTSAIISVLFIISYLFSV